MGDSSFGEAQGWDSPLARGLAAEFNSPLHVDRSRMGLRCWEAWRLPSDERPYPGCKVCYQRQQVYLVRNRRPKLVKGKEDEDEYILSACSKIDAGREDSRRVRRRLSRHGCKQPAEAREVRQVPYKEEEEKGQEGKGEVGTTERDESGRGFSFFGSLAELQPSGASETLQTETAVAMGPFQLWEDLPCDLFDEVLPSLYGAYGLEESG